LKTFWQGLKVGSLLRREDAHIPPMVLLKERCEDPALMVLEGGEEVQAEQQEEGGEEAEQAEQQEEGEEEGDAPPILPLPEARASSDLDFGLLLRIKFQ
jgi:hypothetical protein